MTVVIGTAGHIDHGKTTLLRALTGIDADRLPEERRRGMTIDVGYAHLALEDGREIDFVDVPGHDKLVGNMLVGAGEIDAAMLVVAADDGPRAQTLEHLGLLDALAIRAGLAVITKADAVEPERVASVVAAVERLLAPTSLAGVPVIAASGLTGDGLDRIRVALTAIADAHRPEEGPPTLGVDRVFSVKGRGLVVTGTLRGGPLARGDALRVVPGDAPVRVREIQVHGRTVERVDRGGRTALNLAVGDAAALRRGMVLTADPAVVASDRILVRLTSSLPDRTRGRLHLGTAVGDAAIGRAGRDGLELAGGVVASLRLGDALATRTGDRFVLRRGAPRVPVGGVVLDPLPARGISRRRQTAERVERLDRAVIGGESARDAVAAARLELHGALADGRHVTLADDVARAAAETALEAVGPAAVGAPLTVVRAAVERSIRRRATIRRDAVTVAAAGLLDALVADGDLVREGDRLRRSDVAAAPPIEADAEMRGAMARLEAALAVPAPPALSIAARQAACPDAGVRALASSGRIVLLEPDLAYAMSAYRDLAARALAMASREPLTPAGFRDATGTSRKYVMAILEDLDRRAILRRTPDGHVPGPKAPGPVQAAR
jgi:selenocysteine-specific elongation factor